MKNLFKIIFILSITLISTTYAYEAEKGKIDTHGGNSDSLTTSNAFGMAVGLGQVLNKKSSDEEKEDDKKFIPLEKTNKIEKIDSIKN